MAKSTEEKMVAVLEMMPAWEARCIEPAVCVIFIKESHLG